MPIPAEERVPFVGLTGGLGAGKSSALEAFADLGAATFSTDAAVHELLGGQELREQIVERLGSGVVSGGEIDRTALAAQVFSSPGDRRWLESVLWPRVGEQVAAWRETVLALEDPPPAAVVEVPLLFEAGMEEGFHKTIAVVAEESLRASRAGARGHAAVGERAGRQLSQEEKSQRADFTVRNDGTLEELKAELSEVLDNIAG